jgi:hypothetical protein
MLKRTLSILVATLVVALLSMTGCKRSAPSEIAHSGFHPRIAAFTSGYIPTNGSFIVQFNDSVPSAMAGQTAPSSVASISPKVKGNWTWTDNRTLQFTPAARLEPGKTYQVTMHLKKLLEDEKEDFFFEVATIPQNYRITTNYLTPAAEGDYDNYKVTGSLTVADDITLDEAKAVLEAKAQNKTLPIAWTQTDGKTFLFEIVPLRRLESAYNLELHHSGEAIGATGADVIEIPIPAIGDFSVQAVETEQQPRQSIRFVFSAPLDDSRDITGLYLFTNGTAATHFVNGNVLEIYPSQNIYGDYEIVLLPGLRSVLGDVTEDSQRFQLNFSSLDPAIEFIGQGNIMPYSDQLLMHFKAVSLKSVIVRVIKIYESNIPHFLQINALDESSQLKRAGRLVHQSVISLEKDATLDLNKWNTYALDLSKMIQPDPGAIYRIELGFERMDASFPCSEEETGTISQERKWMDDGDFWDEADSYYSEYPYQYEYWDWEERDNPCSEAYYQRDRWVSRNVLASNLGVIAKSGVGQTMHAYVTDLTSTVPWADASVEVLDYQLQSLAKGKTDAEGMALLTIPKGKPFLMVVKKDQQRGYLRLDDGRTLSVSRFDVAGQTLRDGLKGYLYGERGVWRPGDSIFVSFIPQDKNKRLPGNHPVTFELINPRGQVVQRMVDSHPQNLIYSFRTATAEDAPTGFWQARVSMGDAVFEQSLRIETIKPNRLRVELGFDAEVLSASQNNTIAFKSEWLHGAAAANLKADVRLTVKQTSTTFDKYPNFIFDDAARRFESSERTLFDGRLDANGETTVTMPAGTNYRAPGFLNASFVSRVYEEGGSFSIQQTSKKLSPYKNYVGIRTPEADQNNYLITDKDYKIDLATVSETGQAVSIKNLKYAIYKINWRWWWDRTDEDLARYVSSGSATLIKSGTVNTNNGQGTVPFKIEHPEWGRYLIRVEDENGGHSTSATVLVDWPGWAQKPGRGGADAAAMLLFNSDKEKYEPGQTATVTFPSSGEGRALVSLENGAGVLRSWWVQPQKESTSFTFEVTEEMTPNIYVHISYLQPHKRNNNDLPIRMYGVIPVMVHNSASILQPEIKTAAEWRPMQKATVEVSEANNQSMNYTLAVVDDGLLDLTNFKTPNAWNHFNAREALGSKTWDIYDYVLGAYGGRIERIFGIGGGDDMIGADAKNQTRRFEPMVKFMGPYTLKKRGKNKHEIDIPNYTGSVRVMVVATNGAANGSADQRVAIKSPLMVWSSMPRVLGPDETVLLPVTVFASGKAVGKVKVSVQLDDLLTATGPKEQTVDFNKEGEQTIYFELKAGAHIGVAKVEVTARAGSESGSNTIHLPVRNPNPPMTVVKSVTIPKQSTKTIDYALFGVAGSNSSVLELSTIPPIDFGRRLKFLLQYPHGCIEQITSGGFPQLYMPDIIEMKVEEVSKSQANVQSVINRLRSYQTGDGGMAYWPGGNQSDDWGSSYAGHFMLEAEKKGYTIPQSVKQGWLRYQKNKAAAWVPDRSGRYNGSDFVQAYRLFTLALAGETEMGGMNRLRQQPNLSNPAKWRLAAAYAYAGMGEVAREVSQSLPTANPEQVYAFTYGSESRDLAMVIETLLLMGEREQAAPLTRQLAKSLNSSQWMSTQTTAYSLLALSRYTQGLSSASANTKAEYKVNNERAQKISFSKPLFREVLQLETQPKGKMVIENASDKEIFAQLILGGQPLKDTLSVKSASGLTMQIDYRTLDNRPIDIASLPQGTDFKAIVTLGNPGTGTITNLALTQIFPSGWEIRNTRMEESAQVHELDQPDYRDVRDDRVLSYLDLNRGQSKKLVVLLHASYAGEFFLPAVTCEAMYDHNIRALMPGQWVKVLREE